MIVSKGNEGYMIIMADSEQSEVVIRLKEEAARELRDKLDVLLHKKEEEDTTKNPMFCIECKSTEKVTLHHDTEYTYYDCHKCGLKWRERGFKLKNDNNKQNKRGIINECNNFRLDDSIYCEEHQDKQVALCKLKNKFCEHALRKEDGTNSGYYPNNEQIGYGCCGGEYCE